MFNARGVILAPFAWFSASSVGVMSLKSMGYVFAGLL
jgi:hypothetical protein